MHLFEMTIIAIGENAHELHENGYLVTFVETAPSELAEFSVLVAPGEFQEEVRPGDVLLIDGSAHRITAVGELANKNLRQLAHAIWQFDGLHEPEKPGAVHLEQLDLPDLKVGTRLTIRRDERS